MNMITKLAAGVVALALGATAAEASGNQPPNPNPVPGGGSGGCNGKPTCGGTTPDPVAPPVQTVTNNNNPSAGASSTSDANAAAAAEAAAKAKAAANAEGGRSSIDQKINYEAAAAPVVLGSDGSGYCTKGKAAGISLVEVGVSARGYSPDMNCVNTVAQYGLAEDALKETFKAVKDGIATPEAAGVAFAGTVKMLPKWEEAATAGTSTYAGMFMSPAQRTVIVAPPAGAPVQATEQGAPAVKCPPKTRWNGSVCEYGQP